MIRELKSVILMKMMKMMKLDEYIDFHFRDFIFNKN
jgi:hypothetical protein